MAGARSAGRPAPVGRETGTHRPSRGFPVTKADTDSSFRLARGMAECRVGPRAVRARPRGCASGTAARIVPDRKRVRRPERAFSCRRIPFECPVVNHEETPIPNRPMDVESVANMSTRAAARVPGPLGQLEYMIRLGRKWPPKYHCSRGRRPDTVNMGLAGRETRRKQFPAEALFPWNSHSGAARPVNMCRRFSCAVVAFRSPARG